nr:hypothetical protein [Bacteroidota bacterium]
MTVAFLLTMFQMMAQNGIWTFPNMQLRMTNNALPIVSAINGGVPLTTINNYNAIQDDNGNLLFYVVDSALYDNNGTCIAELMNPIFNTNSNASRFCYGFPEVSIFPTNSLPNCNTYYILMGGLNTENINSVNVGGGITPVFFIYDAFAQIIQGLTYSGNVIQATGTSINGPLWTIAGQNHLQTLNYAVTRRICNNNGNRIVYIFNGLQLYYSIANNAGITNALSIPSTINYNYPSAQFKSEMETIIKSDGTILLAFYSYSGNSTFLNIYHFQADGINIISQQHLSNVFVNGLFKPVGFEFSPSGNYLYFTCENGNTINYFDINAGTVNAMPVNGINQTDYAHSQIEMAKDGRLYFVRNAPGNLLLTTFNTPENPTSNNWTLNAVPAINFAFPTGYRDIGILPDQQDGENYDTKGIVVSKPTITQTPMCRCVPTNITQQRLQQIQHAHHLVMPGIPVPPHQP